MQSKHTKAIALSGVLAATAVVIMCLGGFIPVATYVCPLLCMLTQFLVLRFCGKRMGWTWFIAVALLSVLLSPDKEAAMVFLAVGYYPLIKFNIEKCKGSVAFKLIYFNLAITVAYMIMMNLLGMAEVASENMEFGVVGLIIILFMGNVTFILADRLLTMMARKMR